MAIIENVYTTLGGGTLTSFTAGTLRYDASRNCLWLFHDANGMRRFGMSTPYAETAQYLGDGALDAATAADIGVGEHSGYAYGNDTAAGTNSQKIFKVDPTDFSTVATFGTNSASLTASSTEAIRFAANTEALDSDGNIYLLACGVQHGLSILHADGTALTHCAVENAEGLLDQMSQAVAITPDPVTGKARWLYLVQPSGVYVDATLRLIDQDGTVSNVVVFDSAGFLAMFGNPYKASSAINFMWDRVHESVVLVGHTDPAAGNDVAVVVNYSLADGILWSTSIDLGGTTPQYSPATIRTLQARVENYIPVILTEKTMGGDDLSLYLLSSADGSIVDSGVSAVTSDLVGATSSAVWLESFATLYWQTGDTSNPLVAYQFTAVSSDPDDPDAPEEVDTEYATILRSSNLTSVMNQAGVAFAALLANYADTDGGLAFVVDNVDMNGYKIEALGSGTAPSDAVTLAQFEALLNG